MVAALHCVQCGAALELPADLQQIHIDCPYCGRDNVLPQHLLAMRQRQYHDQQYRYAMQQHASLQHHRLSVQKEKQKSSTTITLVVVGLLVAIPLAACGGCWLMVESSSEKKEKEKQQARNPTLNGRADVLATIERLRGDGCGKLLRPPESYAREVATTTIRLEADGRCVRFVAATTTAGNDLRLEVQATGLESPVTPTPSRKIEYEYCPVETNYYHFVVNSSTAQPFTVAIIQCGHDTDEATAGDAPDAAIADDAGASEP